MKKFTLVVAMLLTMLLQGCSSNLERFTSTFTSFDTVVDLTVFTRNQSDANVYIEQTRTMFDHLHKLFDAFQPADGFNNVYTINQNAGIAPVSVEPELFSLIQRSVQLYNQGLTKTNISLAPVTRLYTERYNAWQEGNDNITMPTQQQLDQANACVGMDNIVLDEHRHTVFLKNECNRIDVGAVAKGYATGLIADALRENGLEHAVINAGGNVAVINAHPDNRKFIIGIADPDNPADQANPRAIVHVENTNMVTSGDYNRYFMYNGQRMHHLIDPDTLLPGRVNRSVTVIHPDGLLADYISTDAFLLPVDEIEALRQRFNFEYIVISADGTMHISEGIKDEVETR